MSLDLSPHAASILEDEASRAGVSVDTLIERTFARTQPAENPMLQWLQAQLAAAETATPKQIAQGEAEYRQWQKSMNATRQANGERLLFPDVAKP